MAASQSLRREGYADNDAPARTTALDFGGPLPKPTGELDVAKGELERVGVIVGYCPPWCRAVINSPLAPDPDVMTRASQIRRACLVASPSGSTTTGKARTSRFAPCARRDHGVVSRPAGPGGIISEGG